MVDSAPTETDTTINLHAITNVINKEEPDLVALQEVDVNNRRSGLEINQAQTLAQLTDMNYYFTEAIELSGGSYGDAVLSRFPLVDSLRYELPVTMQLHGETTSVSLIKIKLSHEKQILFASTHLDHLKSKKNRTLQVNVLRDIVSSFTEPLIIAGDFNATPNSSIIQFLDNFLTMTCNSDCPFTFPNDEPARTIDYIFYTPGRAFQTHRITTVKTNASDHLPLVVEMTVL